MEDEALKELKQVKEILAKVFRTSTLPFSEQFTPEVLDRIQNDFQNLRNMADQWIEESDLYDFLKVDCSIGNLLKKNFHFLIITNKGRFTSITNLIY